MRTFLWGSDADDVSEEAWLAPAAAIWLHRVGVGIVLLHLAPAAIQLHQQPNDYRGPWGWIWWSVLAATLAVSVWQCRPGSTRFSAMRVGLVLSLVYPLTLPWLGAPVSSLQGETDPYPAIFALTGAYSFTAASVLTPRFAATYQVAWAAASFPFWLHVLGGLGAAEHTAQMLLIGLTCTAFTHAAHATLEHARQEMRQTLRLVEQDVEEHAAHDAKLLWDSLVHDKVIGALAIAGRSQQERVPAGATALAQDALQLLDGGEPPAESDIAARLRDSAQQVGLTLSLRVAGSLGNAAVATAIADSAHEALVNVAKHAGVRRVQITAELSDDSCLVVIVDRGCGFDPRSIPSHRGLSLSVLQRMERVGGSAEVQSTPGMGTRITLRHSAEPAPHEPVIWPLRLFRHMIVLGFITAISIFASGSRHWWEEPYRYPNIALGLCLIVILAWSLWMRRFTWHGHVIGLVPCVLLAVAPFMAAPDDGFAWRHWYLAMINLLPMALATRHFRVWAVVYTLGQLGAVMLAEWWLGNDPSVVFANAGAMHVGVLLVGIGMSIGLNRASAVVAEHLVEQSHVRRRQARRMKERREAARRGHALAATVGPMLRQLADGGPLYASTRARCLALEAQARDELACPLLMHDDFRQALSRARHLGAHVTLVVRGIDGWEFLQPFAKEVLTSANVGDNVTIAGGASDAAPSAAADWSCTYTGPRVTEVAAIAAAWQQLQPGCAVYTDADCVFASVNVKMAGCPPSKQ